MTLDETKKGHKGSAKQLLKQISTALETDPSSIPDDVNQWLATALKEISSDPKGAQKHLGLTGKAKHHKEKNVFIYDFICESGLGLHKLPGDINGKSEGAFFAAAKTFGISASKAETIHGHYKQGDDAMAERYRNEEQSIDIQKDD